MKLKEGDEIKVGRRWYRVEHSRDSEPANRERFGIRGRCGVIYDAERMERYVEGEQEFGAVFAGFVGPASSAGPYAVGLRRSIDADGADGEWYGICEQLLATGALE